MSLFRKACSLGDADGRWAALAVTVGLTAAQRGARGMMALALEESRLVR
jgi:hypothetical protein